jgi:[ribosomal protein S5]-alanine N-acetyltransferase
MDGNLTLRAFQEHDLEFLDRLCADPAALGAFEWFGFRDVRSWRRRWEQDGSSARTPPRWRWSPRTAR